MVSDAEIATQVESLLRHSPPSSITSLSSVVHHLESTLGLDLQHKAPFIRHHIDQLLLLGATGGGAHHQFTQQHHHFHPQFLNPHCQQQQQELVYRYGPPTGNAVAAAHHQFQQQQQQFQQVQGDGRADAVRAPPVAAVEAKESAVPAPTGVKRRGGPGGLSKVCGVSPELQAIVGEPTMARTQIVKQLWAYIRKNNLQDPNNKRKIICNDELRLVFETDCTDMFKMNKLLAKHIIPLEPTKTPGSKRLKVATVAAEVASTPVASTPETDASQHLVVISDALAEFFGTGEREILEAEALRRVWGYIKANHLEDPVNTMVVSCDPKLQQLFGCEKLSALGIPEMLARHLFKQS